jgi:hypothetical protein
MKEGGMDRTFHMYEGEIQYVLFGNLKTAKTPGRHERRWKDSITMHIDEIQGGGGVRGIVLFQDREQSGIL